MCFKMDLRSDSHSHSARLSFSPFFPPDCFHPASFSLMAHTCQERGPWHRGDDARSGPAGSPGVRSQCPAYSTQAPLSANPPVQTAPPTGARPLCNRGQKQLVTCVLPASRATYCSNASTLEREPPKTAIIATLRIFLLPQWVCN